MTREYKVRVEPYEGRQTEDVFRCQDGRKYKIIVEHSRSRTTPESLHVTKEFARRMIYSGQVQVKEGPFEIIVKNAD